MDLKSGKDKLSRAKNMKTLTLLVQNQDTDFSLFCATSLKLLSLSQTFRLIC